jgi:mono/diheme cytochrome c family protein
MRDERLQRPWHYRVVTSIWMIASALMTATPGAIANEGASHLLRGEVIFAVNCGRCHINATARFATPAEEMDWLFRPTGPVRARSR